MNDSADQHSPEPGRTDKREVLNLDELTPPKVAVETSVGTLYVGSHGYPIAVLNLAFDNKVGAGVLRHVCNRNADRKDCSPLGEEDTAALLAEDVAKLGPIIAKQQRWPDDEQPSDLNSLGQAATRSFEDTNAQFQAQVKKLNDSLKSNFSFLTQSTLAKLQTDMGAVAQMHKVGDLLKTSGVGRAMEELQKHQALQKPANSILDQVSVSRSAADAIQEALGETGGQHPNIRRLEVPIFRPEESTLGRAALQSAENSELAVKLMTQMTQKIGSLQETLVARVLPEWFADVRRRQDEAKASSDAAAIESRRAATNLRLTAIGIGVSIVVTALATIWQIWVAKEIDTGNTNQLDKMQAVLEAQRDSMIEQQRLQTLALEQQRSQLAELQALPKRLHAQKPLHAEARDSKRETK